MKRLTNFSALLVLLIAAAGFALSYQALYDYGLANGINFHLAWLWPLIIDGFMLVISLSILRASLLQESVRYLWALAILATVVSVGFNIAHAPATVAGRAVAMMAPLAMFAAFETFIRQVRCNTERKHLQESLPALQAKASQMQAQESRAQESVKTLKEEIKLLQSERKRLEKENSEMQAGDTRSAIAMFYLRNPEATQENIAQAVGVSRARVGQIMKELRKEPEMEKAALNGKGHPQ